MKKTIFILAISTLSMGLITSCKSGTEKVEDAKENIAEEQKDVEEAKIDYVEEYEKFKADQDLRMAENEKQIAEMKAKTAEMKKDARADYEKRVVELETKNAELRAKLRDYKHDEHDNTKWETFKREFNHDMDEMGNAFRDLGKNNAK
ncbi:MAG: hypothetical protein K0S53_1894 [Bacteroidetes bacterium]|jgi:hypothetical protein|nr:hypothetical protein [Bacteroidota bacterium]MDF2450924.1 hypothetical protein [Bacteroidota bacterium]